MLIGFESPGEWGLRGLELKRDWKLRRWRESKEAVRRIQSFGIRVNGCFILGLDGHGPEIFDKVLRVRHGRRNCSTSRSPFRRRSQARRSTLV